MDREEGHIVRDKTGRFKKGSKAALGRRPPFKATIPREVVLEVEAQVNEFRKSIEERFVGNSLKLLMVDQVCLLQKSILLGKWSCDNQGSFVIDRKSLSAGYLDMNPMIKSLAVLIREQRLLLQALGDEGEGMMRPMTPLEKAVAFDRAKGEE